MSRGVCRAVGCVAALAFAECGRPALVGGTLSRGVPALAGGVLARGALTTLCRLRGGTTSDHAPVTVAGLPALTLEAADAMANAALAEATAKNFNAISVFVLAADGRVLVSKTMLGCPRLIPSLAHGKAGAAIGTHASSRALKDKYVPDRTPQLLAMTATSLATQNQPFCAVPGGVLCRDEANNVIGAIGVSGASADEDEHCAIVGAQAVGLVTEPPRSALA